MGCYGSTALSSLQRNVFHCNGTKDRRAVIPKALHCTDHETYAATEISLTNDIAATLRHASAPTNPRSANSHGSRSQTRSQDKNNWNTSAFRRTIWERLSRNCRSSRLRNSVRERKDPAPSVRFLNVTQ
ncbi:uncharacterized protein [Dermacentor albipictus]|uniref:uncharacterized protein isoform X2 n=1 Tax=Dermacentor albipictus TaxID=60249 RepID=UPI0038FBFA25